MRALCGAIVLGQLADRFGRRNLLAVIIFGYSTMLRLGLIVATYAELLMQRFLLGIFLGASFPICVGIYVPVRGEDPADGSFRAQTGSNRRGRRDIDAEIDAAVARCGLALPEVARPAVRAGIKGLSAAVDRLRFAGFDDATVRPTKDTPR